MKKGILALAIACISGFELPAADFFSTEHCENLFDLGVRVGLNTSNRTINSKALSGYNYQGWGLGFTAGVVADINVREYLAIQPGVFFESRSGHCSFVNEGVNISNGQTVYLSQEAHRRSYNPTVPVLASFRFNITDNLRWKVEAGPYFGFLLSSDLKNKSLVATDPAASDLAFTQKPASFDFGFKLGTGLQFSDHYYFGIHYEAGAIDAYKDLKLADGVKQSFGGKTKAWTFTIGYDF